MVRAVHQGRQSGITARAGSNETPADLNFIHQYEDCFERKGAEKPAKFIFYSGTKKCGRTMFSPKWHLPAPNLYQIGALKHAGAHRDEFQTATGTISEVLFLATESHLILRCSGNPERQRAIAVIRTELSDIYRDYIACLISPIRERGPSISKFDGWVRG